MHLLLIPGTAFLIQGRKIQHQVLQSHHADLNHSLLLIGWVIIGNTCDIRFTYPTSVLATMLPTAFFASLDRGIGATLNEESGVPLVSDFTRGQILKISRGISIILIIVYVSLHICSRGAVTHKMSPQLRRVPVVPAQPPREG